MSQRKNRKRMAEMAKRVRLMQARHGKLPKTPSRERREKDVEHWRNVAAEIYNAFRKANAEHPPKSTEEMAERMKLMKKAMRERVKDSEVLRISFAKINDAMDEMMIMSAIPAKRGDEKKMGNN